MTEMEEQIEALDVGRRIAKLPKELGDARAVVEKAGALLSKCRIERDDARVQRDRLAETLREVLSAFPGRLPSFGNAQSRLVAASHIAGWRAVLDEQSKPEPASVGETRVSNGDDADSADAEPAPFDPSICPICTPPTIRTMPGGAILCPVHGRPATAMSAVEDPGDCAGTCPRYATGWRDAVATLRDDRRYTNWWTSRDYPPGERYWESEPRNHLADYLRTVGPDGPEVGGA